MKISVFTPTHNTTYLSRVFDSLKKQTYKNWEWIVVPNNNVEISLPKDKRLRVIPCDKSDNIGYLKNYACSFAIGDILFEMDHDDELFSNALEECVKAFKNKKIDFVYSNSCDVYENYKPRVFSPDLGWRSRKCLYENKQLIETVSFPPNPASFSKIWYAPNHFRAWKKSFYNSIGGFDPNLDILEDHDLLCRTYIYGNVLHIDKPLYVYHLHDEGSSYKKRDKIEKMTLLLHEKYIGQMVDRWCDLNGYLKIDGDEFQKNVGVYRVRNSDFDFKKAYNSLVSDGWVLTENVFCDKNPPSGFQLNYNSSFKKDYLKFNRQTPGHL